MLEDKQLSETSPIRLKKMVDFPELILQLGIHVAEVGRPFLVAEFCY